MEKVLFLGNTLFQQYYTAISKLTCYFTIPLVLSVYIAYIVYAENAIHNLKSVFRFLVKFGFYYILTAGKTYEKYMFWAFSNFAHSFHWKYC